MTFVAVLAAFSHPSYGSAEDRPKPPLPAVVQAVVTARAVHTWTVDDPPSDDGFITLSTVTRRPLGPGPTVRQPVHSFVHAAGHQFPLRWSAGPDHLRSVGFYVGAPRPPYVPTRAPVARIRTKLVVGSGPSPLRDPVEDDGVVLDSGELIISSTGDGAGVVDLEPGFAAAYARDPDQRGLATIAPEGQLPADGRPTFTFDFTPPDKDGGRWTLYVQRAPRKTLDVIILKPSPRGRLVVDAVESFPVPFAEPFYAHHEPGGRLFLVTEQTGRVFAAEPPAPGRPGWATAEVWSDPKRPVVAVVRDVRDGSAYAGVSGAGTPGRGDDGLLPLAGKPALRPVDLRKVATPPAAVPERARAALWFGTAVAAERPGK